MRVYAKFTSLTALALFVSWSALARCWAAAFDCSATHLTILEKRICGNPTLSHLDFTLGFLYSRVKTNSALSDRSKISGDERLWVARRNECRDDKCLLAAYRTRIAELSSAEAALFGRPSSTSNERQVATPLAFFQETYDGIVGAMEFSADDSRLAIVPGGIGDDLHVWEWRDHPRLLMKLDWPSRYPSRMGTINTIAYSRDGRLLAFGHDSNKSDGVIKTVRIYNAESGRLVHEIFEPAAENPTFALAFTPDSRSLIELHPGQNRGGELIVYRVSDWRRTVGPLKYPFTASARSMAVSPAGDLVAVGGELWRPNPHPQIALVDLQTFAVRILIDGPFEDWNTVSSVCWDSDGHSVIAGTSFLGRSGADQIKVFSSQSGAGLGMVTTDKVSVTQLTITEDGKYLVVGSLRDILIIDRKRQRLLQKLNMTRGPLDIPIALSHDGRFLAAAAGNNITIWKLQ